MAPVSPSPLLTGPPTGASSASPFSFLDTSLISPSSLLSPNDLFETSDASVDPLSGVGALMEVETGTLLDGVLEGLPDGVLVSELLFSTSVRVFFRKLLGAWLLLDLGVVSEAALPDPAEPWERTDTLEPTEDTREDVARLLLLSNGVSTFGEAA